ncbi:hypothetical protein LOTGIDRAFT_173817, partial [Lottia gigantea]
MDEVSKRSVMLFQCSICYEVFKSIEELLIHNSQHVQVKGHKLVEITTEPEYELVDMNDIEVACDVEVGTDDSGTVILEESPGVPVPVQNPEELSDKATEASDDDSSVTESDLSDSMVDEPAWNDFEMKFKSSSQNKNLVLSEYVKDTPASLMNMKNSELLKYIEADHGLPASRQASQASQASHLEDLIKTELPLKSQDLNQSPKEKYDSNLDNVCNKCERRFWNATALMKHTCESSEHPYNTRRKSSPIKLK